MKIRIFTFFSHTGTVPGGSSLGAICKLSERPFVVRVSRRRAARHKRHPLDLVPKQRQSAPLFVTELSRVAYKVYAKDRAVVFCGIDQSVSTQTFEPKIIGQICQRENLQPQSAWTFYNLLTALHHRGMSDGQWQFVRVLLKTETDEVQVIGSLPVECPEAVLSDFDDYIFRLHDPDDPNFPPFEYDRSSDDESLDLEEDNE